MWYFCDAEISATSTQKIFWKLKKDMTNWTNVNMFLPISSLRNGHKKIKYFFFFSLFFSLESKMTPKADLPLLELVELGFNWGQLWLNSCSLFCYISLIYSVQDRVRDRVPDCLYFPQWLIVVRQYIAH